VLVCIGQYARYQKGHVEVLTVPGLLIGATLFLWGSISLARGKGYTWRLGMVGLLGLIGVIVLALMPDQNKRSAGAKVPPEEYPPSPDSSASGVGVAGDQDKLGPDD
jgi:hypothetical protein